MWTTRVEAAKKGGFNIPLYREDVLFAVIPFDEWWVMSATELIANRALQAEGLNFKANEVKGESPEIDATWTTTLVPADGSYGVHLLRRGELTAVISLEEWAKLPATEWVVEDTLDSANGLLEYGDNIEEVNQALKDELDNM